MRERTVKGSVLNFVALGLELIGGDGSTLRLSLDTELTELTNELLDLLGLFSINLLLELLESLLGFGSDRLGSVGGLDEITTSLVSFGVSLSLLNHGLDLLVGKTGRSGDGDRLILVGGLVLGRDVDDTIGINVEGDLDLRDTLGSGRDANKLKVSEHLVVTDELTFSLEDLDLDSSLSIGSSREGLRLLGRDSGVSVDETGEDTSEGLKVEKN